MKLGFVSAILPELSLEELLVLSRNEGFDCVEAMCWPVGEADRKYAGVTHVDVVEFSQAKADDINALCAQHQVNLSALGYYPNPLDPEPKAAQLVIDHLKKVILAAEMLGLSVVNTFAGRDWKRSVDDNWPLFLRTWRPLVAFAEDHGIRIGMENCPMYFTRDEWPGGKNLLTTPDIWRRAFNDIPSPSLGLNYDPSHLVLQHIDPAGPLPEFQDKIFHFHAKDVRIQKDRINEVGIFAHPLEWHQPRIPGHGEMDWPVFMGKLMQTTYKGPLCIEVEDDTFGETLEGRKEGLFTAAGHLRPLLDNTLESV